jgi:hypothetical protein
MITRILPILAAKLDGAAALIAESPDDSVVVEGEENKILVKPDSVLGKEKLESGMVLFTHRFGTVEYLVCINEARR